MLLGTEKDIFVVEFEEKMIPLLFDVDEGEGDGLFGDDAVGEGKCMIRKSIHP